MNNLDTVSYSDWVVVTEKMLLGALPDALSLATEQDSTYAYSDEPNSPYVRFLAAALLRRLQGKVNPCDYCDEGNIPIDGWHEIEDPEGIEGIQRIPCSR